MMDISSLFAPTMGSRRRVKSTPSRCQVTEAKWNREKEMNRPLIFSTLLLEKSVYIGREQWQRLDQSVWLGLSTTKGVVASRQTTSARRGSRFRFARSSGFQASFILLISLSIPVFAETSLQSCSSLEHLDLRTILSFV